MKKNSEIDKPIIVNLEDDALGNIQGIADELAEKGMKIKRVLPIMGVISGSYSNALSDIEKVTGVKSAEEEFKAYF